MAGSSLAVIVASLHGRTGKTLLARTLADYFILSGLRPYIFDTDAVDRELHGLFPHDAFVVDLAIVPDQMLLFDTLAVQSARTRIVDVTHRSLITFFQLMRDSDFVSEARSCEVEPVIFYIPDRKVDSFEAGVVLRNNFPDCPFVVVENAFLGEPKDNARGRAYRALRAHELRFLMPELDEAVAEELEERALSLSDFIRRPISYCAEALSPDGLSLDLRLVLRAWVFRMFQEIHGITTFACAKT